VRLAPLFAALLDDLEAGREPGFVGSRLHATLAAIVRDACLLVRDATRLQTVALSGGVFQNRLFSELCEHELEKAGLTVLTHALVPCNDGGLSLGQAVVAGYTLLRQRDLLD
jgi:hydrogenase maturation protein HypF